MRNKRVALKMWIGIGFVAGMSLAKETSAQTLRLEIDQLSFLQMEAGPVELDLEVVLSSAFALDTVNLVLTSDAAAQFAYRDPVFTIGAPFREVDLSAGTLPEAGQTLDQPGGFQFYSVAETFGPERFPARIMTLHLASVNDLDAGTYTFSFDPLQTQWGNDFQLNPFVNLGTFTLTVTASDSEDGSGDNGNGSSDGGGGGGSGGGTPAPALCGAAAVEALAMSLLMLGIVPFRRVWGRIAQARHDGSG